MASGKVSGGAGRSEVPQDRPAEADGGAGRRGWTTGMGKGGLNGTVLMGGFGCVEQP